MHTDQDNIEEMKKMTVLRIIRKRGELEALRLYPEYTSFILKVRNMELHEASSMIVTKDDLIPVLC